MANPTTIVTSPAESCVWSASCQHQNAACLSQPAQAVNLSQAALGIL